MAPQRKESIEDHLGVLARYVAVQGSLVARRAGLATATAGL
jgi:hypothetical protein